MPRLKLFTKLPDYVMMTYIHVIYIFVDTPRIFIIAKLSIREPDSSSVLIIFDLLNSHSPFYIHN